MHKPLITLLGQKGGHDSYLWINISLSEAEFFLRRSYCVGGG
jgi:hypothetical protein